MKKFLSVLIVLMFVMTFIACENDSPSVVSSNAGQIDEENTILIGSEEEYLAFVSDVNAGLESTKDKLVKLTSDIDFSGTGEAFVPFDMFEGTFDGDNFLFSYCYTDSAFEGYFGLFKATGEDVVIKNLNLLVDIDITAAEDESISVGALIGKNNNLYLTLTDVVVSGNITVNGKSGAIGGFVGSNGSLDQDYGKAENILTISGSSNVNIVASEEMSVGKFVGELFWTKLEIQNYSNDMVGQLDGSEISE